MTVQVCPDGPFPSFDSLYNQVKGLITFPPNIDFTLHIPSLPSLPSPIYPDISHFALELNQMAQEIQSFSLLNTISGFLMPLIDFLSFPLPEIPLIGLDLLDLLSFNPDKLYESIRKAILQFQFPDIDFTLPDFTLPTFSLPSIPIPAFPTLPIPMFGTLSIPSIELNNTVKLILKDYMNVLVNLVPNLIQMVKGILDPLNLIPSLTLPTFPTLDQIKAQIAGLVQWPDFDINLPGFPPLDFLKGFSVSQLIAGLSFPGFPFTITLPDPLIPNYSNLEHELMEGLNIAYQELVAYPMTLIKQFFDLPIVKQLITTVLGIGFPTLPCIPISL